MRLLQQVDFPTNGNDKAVNNDNCVLHYIHRNKEHTMQTNHPDTAAKRKAGMAAFRATMLKTHQALLAGGDVNTKRKGAVGAAARAFHADMITSIKATQKRLGEVA